MPSRLRRNNSARISFFAFQDIITSVSGILILVTLMLATELNSNVASSARESSPELELRLTSLLEQQGALDALNEQLRQSLATVRNSPGLPQLTRDIAALQARLAETKRQLTNAQDSAAAESAAQSARDAALGLAGLREEIAAIQKANEQLQQQVADARLAMDAAENDLRRAEAIVLKARARSGQLWVIPDSRGNTKEPWLVTVSGSEVTAERFDRPQERQRWSSEEAPVRFGRFLTTFPKLDQYIVFLVRPSGIALFERLSAEARSRRVDIGFDALEEKVPVQFSRPPPLEADAAPIATNVVGTAQPETSKPLTIATAPPNVAPTVTTPPAPIAPASPKVEPWWKRLLKALGIG